MSTFIIVGIIIVNFINQDEGYILKVDKNGHNMKYGTEDVLQKSLSSVKQLSATFPNHNVELQLEITGTNTHPPALPQRRIFRVYKKPNLRRSGDDPNTNSKETKTTKTHTLTNKVYTTTSTTTSTSTTPNTLPSTIRNTLAPNRKPIYKEDLEKALDDFERKFFTTTGQQTQQLVHTVPFEKYYSAPPRNTGLINRNIENIVELLKRGIRIENHVEKPSDENLDWLQIKIPKNI